MKSHQKLSNSLITRVYIEYVEINTINNAL